MGLRRLFKKKDKPIVQEPGEVSFDDLEKFSGEREKVYRRMFGKQVKVSHEFAFRFPHIDVYIFPPGQANRSFYTLVSGGMSDMPMQLPDGLDRSYARREIILYCDQPDEEVISLVRFCASFPFEFSTWLGPGHSLPNGSPPKPLFENSLLTGLYFMETILVADSKLPEKLVFQGDPVAFLWAIPITQAEMDLKLEKGSDALLDLFDEHHHPFLLDRQRASYI